MAQGSGVLAAITRDKAGDGTVWGGVACFHARDEAEQRAIALTLAKVLDGMVHALPNGVLVIVRH